MEPDVLDTPLTVRDLVDVFPVLAIELFAAVLPSPRADQALTDLANRLDDMARQTTHERAAAILHALSAQLMGTE